MSKATRLSPTFASSVLVLLALVSAVALLYSRNSSGPVLQPLVVLVSLGLIFFSLHPLGHLAVARALGVHTDYFFIGRSDFRKLESKPMSAIGGFVPTIGTKLRRADFSLLPPRKRGYILGAGVIVSNSFVGIEVLYLLLSGFAPISMVVGLAFLLVTLGTELTFSTKSGDLAKMRSEFRKTA